MQKQLHGNCGQDTCVCLSKAEQLGRDRIENIKRGMPDLPYVVEQRIWKRAFQIHKTRGVDHLKTRASHVIAPTWSADFTPIGKICDCFELARLALLNPKEYAKVMLGYDDIDRYKERE
jgi:hypothetical protein